MKITLPIKLKAIYIAKVSTAASLILIELFITLLSSQNELSLMFILGKPAQ